ncbi:hypothetical protein D9619_010487 [Psilocybe cf. subviscida]|uniref:Uncharacterized protein n=1 Tax=Psilocybe cf. subviscida TaxID=2480587 RepID=A0A8H5AS89_9AGAR|nr:hypothetical protein D9619_010487 [Psilocybe cf. subviscida]
MSSAVSGTLRTDLPRAKPNHAHTRKPNSKIGIFFWRWRMWFEATFVLSMLEPWEKIMLLTGFIFLCVLVTTGILKYLPQHLLFLHRRATYYLWGSEGDERLLWQWLGLVGDGNSGSSAHVPLSGLGLHKEL